MVKENPNKIPNIQSSSEPINKARSLFASQITSIIQKEKNPAFKEKVEIIYTKMRAEIDEHISKNNKKVMLLKIPIMTFERTRNFWVETKEEFKEILDVIFIHIFEWLKIVPLWDSEKDDRTGINKIWKDVSLEENPERQRKISIIMTDEKRYIEIHWVNPIDKKIDIKRAFPNHPGRVEEGGSLIYNNINQYPSTIEDKFLFQTKEWHGYDWIDCYWKLIPCNKLDYESIKIGDGIKLEKIWEDDIAYYSTKDWIIALDTTIFNKKEILRWIKIIDTLRVDKIAFNPDTKHIIENCINIVTGEIIGYLINTKKWNLIAWSIVWWVDIQGNIMIKDTEGPPIWEEKNRIIKANWNINLESVNTNTVYSTFWGIKISKRLKNSIVKGHYIFLVGSKEKPTVIEKSTISTNTLYAVDLIFWSEVIINMWVNFIEKLYTLPESNGLKLIKSIEDIDLMKRKNLLIEEVWKLKSTIEKSIFTEKTQLENLKSHFDNKILRQNSNLLKKEKAPKEAELLLDIEKNLNPFNKKEIIEILTTIKDNLHKKGINAPEFLWKYTQKILSINTILNHIEEKTAKPKEELKKLKEEFALVEYKLNKDLVFIVEWELRRWASLTINYWGKELKKFEYSDNEKENFIKIYRKYNPGTNVFEDISRDEAIAEIRRIWNQTQKFLKSR